MSELRHPIGTFDVLAPDSRRWEALLAVFARVVEGAGYGLVITPTFEDLQVFQRVGASTDIVRKEMYDFEDKGGRRVALRPEVTASVVRAFIQHRPTTPWKAWYAGSNFRYESPQAGRYREFHQVGIEVFGAADADLDVEVMALGWEFYRALGLRRVELMVNSLGDATCRPPYRALLIEYLEARSGDLCDEHRDRFRENPLRVLDCKRPTCKAVAADAPKQVEHLCDACGAHFARATGGLDALGIPWTLATNLVRGLDYYTRTTFEYAGLALDSAQNAVGGGGRYDALVEEMGGPSTPGIGFALGVERILMACDAEGTLAAPDAAVDVFVVDFAGGDAARDLTAQLRAAGVRADRSFDGRSAKAQFKVADRSGARLALVVGPDDAAAGTVMIRPLTGDRTQWATPRDQVVAEVARLLGS
ncbi:histidine--tRNA ligase [Acidiferrimicrobium sp. IK]|uniref:histidine--tRNA ligase n=1 Tax=Acidiferrimicrobium sp. IK TaxID=2871700 RepID=UPI0021CB6F28|nr:histidine--tRNA ligase [Acidiferrimicrobium sp. IK]MCU4184844.1 histidine--tRNA ligase [Acidiferrimicrobium sp. IK]